MAKERLSNLLLLNIDSDLTNKFKIENIIFLINPFNHSPIFIPIDELSINSGP